MIGDKLVITDYHRKVAALIYEKLEILLHREPLPVVTTVAGESGCGKSETAAVLAELCEKAGYKTIILQQDDYFIYPPKTNHKKRLEDINWVGPREVRLELIEANIETIKSGNSDTIIKPLVIYNQDLITEEKMPLVGVKAVIVEGTYTTLIKNTDLRVFINRNYRQTKKARLVRSRDPSTNFLEKVLSIEHDIISKHKEMADVIIPPPADETEQKK